MGDELPAYSCSKFMGCGFLYQIKITIKLLPGRIIEEMFQERDYVTLFDLDMNMMLLTTTNLEAIPLRLSSHQIGRA